jgi:hypothetical protein
VIANINVLKTMPHNVRLRVIVSIEIHLLFVDCLVSSNLLEWSPEIQRLCLPKKKKDKQGIYIHTRCH